MKLTDPVDRNIGREITVDDEKVTLGGVITELRSSEDDPEEQEAEEGPDTLNEILQQVQHETRERDRDPKTTQQETQIAGE